LLDLRSESEVLAQTKRDGWAHDVPFWAQFCKTYASGASAEAPVRRLL
jgi:hypothetical protein